MGAKPTLTVPGSTRKLNGKSLSHEVRSVFVARLARKGKIAEFMLVTYGKLERRKQS